MSKVRRLYEYLQPSHYQIELRPNWQNLTFSGRLMMQAKLLKAQKRLTLHAKGLKISNVKLVGGGQTTTGRPRINAKTSEVDIIFSKSIAAGNLRLELMFTGNVSETMHGLYRGHFTYRGKKQTILATQFEAIHAREAFPCVDEPEAKATFELTVIAPKNLTVLSNTPPADEIIEGSRRRVRFQTTPVMSTYLLALVIGQIDFIATKTKSGVRVRAYATPNNIKHLKFALQTTAKVLEFFEDYFRIPYPLPKLDVIALPEFAAGAMENWGLITFRELRLLVDEAKTSVQTKQDVAYVIAHELAHQWFGNLVTMRWWTDLWLNESFATWAGWLAIDHLFPDWRVWAQFVGNDYMIALDSDCLVNTHPVEVEVKDPYEIQQIFDEISYEKGGSLIRMLHEYLGAKDFASGLSHYLKKHAHDNAQTTDLWRALEEDSGKPVVNFMSIWTTNEGFPIISYAKSKNGWRFKQSRFVTNPNYRQRLPAQPAWPIPITNHKAREQFQLERLTGVWQTSNRQTPKFNVGQSGFYRVQYLPIDLENLAKQVAQRGLSIEDRLGLLADVFAAAKAGLISSVAALNLLKVYKIEPSAPVWDVIITELFDLLRSLGDEELDGLISPYGQELVSEQVECLGWQVTKRDTHFDRLVRPNVLMLAVYFNDPQTISKAQTLFAKHRVTPIEPDLRRVVYTAVARSGQAKDHEQLLKLYKKEELAEEKHRLAAGLASFKDANLLKQTLKLIRSKDVRLQDVPLWINTLLTNRHARKLVWQWLQANWQWFIKSFADSYHASRVVKNLGRAFADHATAQEFRSFFAKHPHPGITRNVKQAIEITTMQAQWLQRDRQSILDYLKAFN
ncbi:M1 family metallopeptidase [Candidatus Microgenomates bacterium]|nr:M1 family metallopeptidase [Candidatus Microgenomates bacterium]